ncbi:DUF72 domain-containing protein [Mesorhizobium sp. J428]|uniref:DUF72 domain-containing protein n=1 Tax=Mesorhizobium sp. J428 TaxID=2898440 RepID=UPI002150FD84|nr:DUF72 domain-containing protein [Mesorhizobium sp. J428]MCR5857183.1 DUF72 domain-containing protein [Mesorhizobium sp. J428]
MQQHPLFIGTAGWSIASRYAAEFPAQGSHLERYGKRLGCVEINTSFYRPHQPKTYLRWAASVPDEFRFSVKLPKAITHEAGLVGAEAALDKFLQDIAGLGGKLCVLLVQLPPHLKFETQTAEDFFRLLRGKTASHIALEPRHPSWFCHEAETMMKTHHVARVAADPSRAANGDEPGGWDQLRYFRLHGTPDVYFSDYSAESLLAIGRRVAASSADGAEVWCIFDNTAKSHALGNALSLMRSLGEPGQEPHGS